MRTPRSINRGKCGAHLSQEELALQRPSNLKKMQATETTPKSTEISEEYGEGLNDFNEGKKMMIKAGQEQDYREQSVNHDQSPLPT